jgi:hypothetical protein
MGRRVEARAEGVDVGSEKDLLLKLIKMLRNWRALCKAVHLQEMERVMEGLTVRLHQPLRLFWEPQATAPSSSSQMAAQSDSATSTGVVFRDMYTRSI